MAILWKSAQELQTAAESNALFESATLDGKKGLPAASTEGNTEIAKDVCAMTVDGGALIYGIGEDDNKQLTVVNPIKLANLRERIDSVVATGIDERPQVRTHELPLADGSGHGFLVVDVPLSARAPHMVVVNGEKRYYGRSATGNIILGQADIERLYARRASWDVDAAAVLDDVVASAPYEPLDSLGYAHVVVRPVVHDRDRWEALPRLNIWDELSGILVADNYNGAWTGGAGVFWNPSGVDKKSTTTAWRGLDASDPEGVAFVQQVDVQRDGLVSSFFGGAVWTVSDKGPGPEGVRVIREAEIAHHLCCTLAVAATFLATSGYSGQVDVGVRVTGIEDVRTGSILKRPGSFRFHALDRSEKFSSDDYLRTRRIDVLALASAPMVTNDLLKDLFAHTIKNPMFDPFAA